MGARYVWGRYTAVPVEEQVTMYKNISNSNYGDIRMSVPSGTRFSVGGSYSFSVWSGDYTLKSVTTYTSDGTYHPFEIKAGYITTSDGKMYYSAKWSLVYNTLLGQDATEYSSQQYQTTLTQYTKGEFVDYISSDKENAYYGGYNSSSGYYYVYEGSDNIDPQAVTLPDPIDDGTTIRITVTPSTEKVYSGTVSYTYQYRYNSSWQWQTLTTTTALTASLQVPKNTYQTLEVRVQAQDNLGFTSSTWVSSGVKNIIANQPPTAPGITVDNVYINQHLTVTLTPATDPDGTVASYIIQRRIDGGQWNQVQSGTSLTYTEVVDPDWGTIAYRAAAVDDEGLQGPWATSQTFDVNPGWVIISGPDSDLGERPGPFVLEFEVEVVGNPDQDSIVTKVMLDDRDLIVDLLLHDEDIVRIYFNTKYFAAGTHTIQVTASKEDYTPAMSVFNVYVPTLSVDPLAGARVEVPQNAQGKPVAWLGLARCILGDDGRDVIQMCGDGLKLAQGSYTGTGTSGQSNPTQLTAGFQPKLAVILAADGTTSVTILAQASGSTATVGGLTVTFTATGLSYWASTPEAQFNTSGTTYSYYIMG